MKENGIKKNGNFHRFLLRSQKKILRKIREGYQEYKKEGILREYYKGWIRQYKSNRTMISELEQQ